METKSRKPIMVEDHNLKRGKHNKLVFMGVIVEYDNYTEFTLETTKTIITRKRFSIKQGCKVTCGTKSYVISAVAPDRFGPPQFYAKEVVPNKADIEELDALSVRFV